MLFCSPRGAGWAVLSPAADYAGSWPRCCSLPTPPGSAWGPECGSPAKCPGKLRSQHWSRQDMTQGPMLYPQFYFAAKWQGLGIYFHIFWHWTIFIIFFQRLKWLKQCIFPCKSSFNIQDNDMHNRSTTHTKNVIALRTPAKYTKTKLNWRHYVLNPLPN